MTNSKDMVECLRKIPTEKLHEAHVDLYFHWHKDSTERSPMNVFSPRSDPEAGPESFLPHHPHVAMKRGTYYIVMPLLFLKLVLVGFYTQIICFYWHISCYKMYRQNQI